MIFCDPPGGEADGLLVGLAGWHHGRRRADVVDTVPSQLVFGLCGFTDRAAFLLEDLAPGHAERFARLRDLLMDHTQGGRRLPDAELHRVAAEVEVTFEEFFPEEPRPS